MKERILQALGLVQSIPKKRISLTSRITVDPTVKTRVVSVDVLIPPDIPGRQNILSVELTPEPMFKFLQHEFNSAFVHFEFHFPHPGHPFEITITTEAELEHADLRVARNRKLPSQLSALEGASFLCAEPFLEKDAADISQAARLVQSNNIELTLKNTMDYVINRMEYAGYDPICRGALHAVKTGKGDCSEFADLFVAICRANNIPARVCMGYTVPYTVTPKHAWSEVYLPALGWVQFDPTYVRSGSATFDKLFETNSYLRLHHHRNMKVRGQRCYGACWFWQGGAPKFAESFSVNGLV